jgi:hypothetical protein
MVSMIVVRRRGSFLLVTIILSLATVPGCGDGKPSVDTSRNEATVTGVVSVNGVPATGGSIHFNPSNSGRIVPTRSADIGPDGKYTIKTYTGDNQVTYGGEVATKNRGVGLRRDFATVQRGENRYDFDVLGAGSKDPTIDYTKSTQRKKR